MKATKKSNSRYWKVGSGRGGTAQAAALSRNLNLKKKEGERSRHKVVAGRQPARTAVVGRSVESEAGVSRRI